MNTETPRVAKKAARAGNPTLKSKTAMANQAETRSAEPFTTLSVTDDIPDEVFDHLGGELVRCAAFSIGWWIRAGQVLLEAKQQLPAEDFPHILASGRLPIGGRSAQVLVRIAGNTALRNPELLLHLPQSISALNELAGLDANLIEKNIRAGTIHSRLTAQEAKRLARQHKGEGAVKKA